MPICCRPCNYNRQLINRLTQWTFKAVKRICITTSVKISDLFFHANWWAKRRKSSCCWLSKSFYSVQKKIFIVHIAISYGCVDLSLFPFSLSLETQFIAISSELESRFMNFMSSHDMCVKPLDGENWHN